MSHRGSGDWWALGAVVVSLTLSPGKLPAQESITVFAAASLADAFTALGQRFQATHPAVRIQFNFAGSQQLALQIEQGAGADLFASADERWMTSVAQRGLLLGEPVTFAANRLAVILPRSNPASIRRLEDLARRGIKLVLAADLVPAGRYAREMLHRLAALPGYGAGYEARVLANVVSEEDNVRGVLAKVQLGEADAGVVYRSDVSGAVRERLNLLEVPETANPTALYPLAIVRGGAGEGLAREFATLVLSPEGQETLTRFGLLPAPATAGGRRT